MAFPIIETARLRLRAFTADAVDDIHGLWIDPDVRRYLWDDEVISREQVSSVVDESISLFEAGGFGLWGAQRPPKRCGVLILTFKYIDSSTHL